MERFELTEFQYNDMPGLEHTWKLFVYALDGYHRGGQWFSKNIKYPDEEITIKKAMIMCADAVQQGLEVRITDGADLLCFHAKGGEVLYPPASRSFWAEIGAETDLKKIVTEIRKERT